MTRPRYRRIRQVEPIRDTLRLTSAIPNAASDVLAHATALRSGTLVDLQASDNDRAGASGRPIGDARIAERTLRRLTHARVGATHAEFDRGRTR